MCCLHSNRVSLKKDRMRKIISQKITTLFFGKNEYLFQKKRCQKAITSINCATNNKTGIEEDITNRPSDHGAEYISKYMGARPLSLKQKNATKNF